MKNIRLSPASFGLLASLFCGAATILFGCFRFLSAADQDVKIVNLPASEGRTITPAGTLLLDAGTRLPAVAPLTVDFVRSPDKNGPDGKGRYGKKTRTKKKSVWNGGVTPDHGAL